MARITAYGVMNILFAAMVAFFWPCYSIYIFCDECDGFLSDAGRLVQYMWYPGTVDLNYGARGPGRYNGGKEESGVLRGACVPCPSQLLEAVGERYKGLGPLQANNPYTQQLDVARAQCVRVGNVGLVPGREYLLRGPRAMSAKDYVLYQLFGPKYETVFQDLYGPGIYEGTGQRKPRELARLTGYFDKGNYNQQLFAAGNPFPFTRGRLSGGDLDTGDHSFLVSGYYMVNGRPLLLPKLWDYVEKYDEKENVYHRFISSNGALWTTVPADYKAQYKTSPKMTDQVHVGLGDYARIIVTVFGKPINGDDSAFMELEWWYPDLCPEKSCGKEWWIRTSLQYWTEEHYQDYAQRFFAGGGDVQAMWVSGQQTLLPNVTINTNAVAQRRRK